MGGGPGPPDEGEWSAAAFRVLGSRGAGGRGVAVDAPSLSRSHVGVFAGSR